MLVHISSVSGTDITVYALDNTTIDDITKRVAKKIDKIPSTLFFYYKDKYLSPELTLSDIKYEERDTLCMQCILNSDEKTEINFTAYDIMGHMALNYLQKELFMSPDIIRTTKAIYSKEHRNPEIQRFTDPDNFKELMSQLEALGFPSVRCANALRRADFCIDLAASLLMDNQEGIQELTEIIELVQCVDDTEELTKVESIQTPPKFAGLFYQPFEPEPEHEHEPQEMSPLEPEYHPEEFDFNLPETAEEFVQEEPIIYTPKKTSSTNIAQINPSPSMKKVPNAPRKPKPTPKLLLSNQKKVPVARKSIKVQTSGLNSPRIEKTESVGKVVTPLNKANVAVRSSLPRLQKP